MSNATKKQIDYATQIANTLGKKLPEQQDFDTINKFISDNREEFYKAKDKTERDLVVSNVSILSIVNEMGLNPIRRGRYYMFSDKGQAGDFSSLVIDPEKNCFYRNSQGTRGSVIDFYQMVTGKSIGECIKDLKSRINVSEMNVTRQTMNQTQQVEEKGKLELPEQASNMRRVYAYLLNTRYLNQDVVQEFVDNKMIYQDTYGNCVFVSYDKDDTPVFACKRGTHSEKRFVADVKNSDYSKGFYIDNNASKTIVTESVIDAMSVMGIIQAKGEDYHSYNYLPLAGAAKLDCLMHQLRKHPVSDVYMALDRDEGGIENIERTRELITEQFPDDEIWIHECLPEYTKDWNEEVKYAFSHQVDMSALDFFRERSNDKRTKELQEKLSQSDDEIVTPASAYSMEEELEL